jgi:copper chaperone CopZ
MKKYTFFILFLFITTLSIGQSKSAKLQASGLTCAMCAKSIYNNLIALDAVESVDTDLNESSFLLKFKPAKEINPDLIRKKVEDAGFAVAMLELNFTFSNFSILPDEHLLLNGFAYHFLNPSKQILNGEQTLRVIDKQFETEKAHKKNLNLSKLACFASGIASSCCIAAGIPDGSKIFHVILINKK